jgi:hypothetical protein
VKRCRYVKIALVSVSALAQSLVAPGNALATPAIGVESSMQPRSSDDVAAGALSDGRLQVWTIRNGSLFTRWKVTTDPASSWTEWSSFPQPGPLQAIAVGRVSSGGLQLFAISTDGGRWTCWTVTNDPQSGWTGWSGF